MRRTTKVEPPSSFIRHNRDGSTTYVGVLATKLFQAIQIRTLLATPAGPFSTRKLLTVAQAFTGRWYEPGERLRAIGDLDDWIKDYELIVPAFEETE